MRRPTAKISKGPQRSPRPIIKVLTEGQKTEPQYIKILGRKYRSNITIKMDNVDTGLAAITLVQRAREYKRDNRKNNPDFDEIWIIFDVDANPDSTINQVIQEARDSNINIVISNPCFELWLVLHCQDQTGYIERDNVQRMARELGIIDEDRRKHIDPHAHQTLLNEYDKARTRAKRLEAMHEGNGSKSWENPSSQVWKFVDRLIQTEKQQ